MASAINRAILSEPPFLASLGPDVVFTCADIRSNPTERIWPSDRAHFWIRLEATPENLHYTRVATWACVTVILGGG